MRGFFTSSDAAYRDLEGRATGTCIRFRNREMPSGSVPRRADVGFEVDAELGAARLLVSRGVSYDGEEPEVRRWLYTGTLEFPSFAALRAWLEGPLQRAYETQITRTVAAKSARTGAGPASGLTDLSAVQEGIRDLGRPLYIDEDEIFDGMRARVLGQDDALRGLVSVVVRHLARRHPARPAVALAVGPSGVGKTRTAETLAAQLREYQDDENGYQFLRLDMTEYQEAHRVSQLIGSPQGYVGHGQGSQLTDALRANPRTIVLFDEIEKAHPAILRVLMNAMDAGRLSTAARSAGGHEVDCRHSIFLFTSNLNAKDILDELDSRTAFGNRAVEDEVCRRRLHAAGVAPEIVGRIGRFLVYRALTPEIRAEIVALSVADVGAEYGVDVEYVEPSVIVEIMLKSRSSDFGVRPEKFLIDDLLGGVFAECARSGADSAVGVAGPPFTCYPLADDGSRRESPEDAGRPEATSSPDCPAGDGTP